MRKIAYSLLEISNIDRKETYQLSRIYVFISTIRQLGISFQMSRQFTILPQILQFMINHALKHFPFIKHMVTYRCQFVG